MDHLLQAPNLAFDATQARQLPTVINGLMASSLRFAHGAPRITYAPPNCLLGEFFLRDLTNREGGYKIEADVATKKRSDTAVLDEESSERAPCACAVSSFGRKAVAVDPEIKQSNLNRLRRIEGQVRGLQKMVTDERYCADIVGQIASVQEALRSVSRAVMQNHLCHCATEAIRRGNDSQVTAQYEELLGLIYKHLR